MVKYLILIRLPNLLVIILTQCALRWFVLDPVLKSLGYSYSLSNLLFGLLVFSTVLIAAAGYVINDYFDTKVDRDNKPNKVIVGRTVKRRIAMILHIVLNLIGIGIGIGLAYLLKAYLLGLVNIVCAALLWYYSTRFKHQPIVGNVIIALLAAFVPFVVVLFDFANNYLEYPLNPLMWVLGFSIFAFLTNFTREIIKDIEDFKGDGSNGSNTFPVVKGVERAKLLVLLSGVVTILTLIYFQFLFLYDSISTVYFILFVHIPMIIAIFKTFQGKQKNDFHISSNLYKVVMVGGVLYSIVISYNFTSI
jgi:4-hydroxybenzoate polyprenyltransferase